VSSPPEIAIVCDTTSYLPQGLLDERGVKEISLYVSLGGDQRRELEIGDYGSFFERLRASDEGATTSQPSIGDFIEVYRPLLDQGKEIISIHLASGISGTYESALQACERLAEEGRGGDRIRVIDSRTGCGGMGMLVLAASAAVNSGESADQIVARVTEAREQLRMWFAIDTLEYLRKGGRIGGAQAMLGSMLSIKPVIAVKDGAVEPAGKVRTRSKALRFVVDRVKEGPVEKLCVLHAQAPDVDEFLAMLEPIVPNTEIVVGMIGPVVGVHTGPAAIGVTWFEPPR
jgi:DegV family protein with EDD domain